MHGQRFFPEGLPVAQAGYCCDSRREKIRVVRQTAMCIAGKEKARFGIAGTVV